VPRSPFFANIEQADERLATQHRNRRERVLLRALTEALAWTALGGARAHWVVAAVAVAVVVAEAEGAL